MTDLAFKHHLRFERPSLAAELRSVAIDDANDWVCLWETGSAYSITRSADAVPSPIAIRNTGRHLQIASLPEDGLVVAQSRIGVDLATGYRRATSAWVLDRNGEITVEGTLGDGIEHVLSTPDGYIWVGYFDEGVFGGGDVAAHGLVRFGPDLEPLWKHPQTGSHYIADCYALNVRGETATTCSYSEFDLLQIRGSTMSSWTQPHRGAHALLIDGASCALLGGYGDRDRVSHLRLRDGVADVVAIGRITQPPPGPAATAFARICRGPEMHLVVGTDWFRVSL